MSVSVSGDGFPVSFTSLGQGIKRSFDTADAIVGYLGEQVTWWKQMESTFAAAVGQRESATEFFLRGGAKAVREARAAASEAVDVHKLAGVLLRLEQAGAVLSDGNLGSHLQKLVQDNPWAAPGFALIAASSLSPRHPFEPSTPQRRINGPDYESMDLLARGTSAWTAYATNRKNDKKVTAVIQREASDLLDELSARRHSIEEWFTTRTAELSSETTAQLEKIASLETTYQSRTEDMLTAAGAAIDRQRKQLIDEQRRAFGELDHKLRQDVDNADGAIRKLIDDTEQNISRISNVYLSREVLDGPSKLWADVRNGASVAKWAYLLIFALLVVAPLGVISRWWPEFSTFLTGLVSSSAPSGISLTAIAALTIPTLAYGWLLRHVSRLFIHNLTLQSDAQYREVLARTFVGLADVGSTGISEAERALVLNALFRPTPPNASDDGPPSGILDLLKRPS